jgi:hypothetical protein
MIWYADQAMFSVRDWDSFCKLMKTINMYRKMNITYSRDKLW